jgi:hypothetical protein
VFTSKQVATTRGKAGGVNIGNVTGYTHTIYIRLYRSFVPVVNTLKVCAGWGPCVRWSMSKIALTKKQLSKHTREQSKRHNSSDFVDH